MQVTAFADDYLGRYRQFKGLYQRRMEAAALIATAAAAEMAKRTIRRDMQAARLGRLGNAIDTTSDLRKGRGVYRIGEGFSASGVIYVRSKSERTLGAIEAYTKGANIRPRKGRWLWIPTDDIQRLVGSGKDRRRLEPGMWEKSGLDRRIGPLVRVRSVNGNPLLVLQDVGVSLAGKRGSAKSLTKKGRARKGQVKQSFVVAFVGIPHTARAARIDVRSILASAQRQLPELFRQALERTF